ncbi:MAG: iron ABC transporter permease [Chloroflexota bacterium]|nr:iron ABC transporter permease [Chloroflexota bacterium]
MASLAGAEQRASVVLAPRVWSWDRPVQWLLAIATAALIAFPLAPIVLQSVLDRPLYDAERAVSLGNYTRILGSAEFWATLLTTIAFGLLTTALAVGIGTALAVVLTRTDVPARLLLHNLVLLPFYVSPLVLAFAWAIVYGPSGFVTLFVRANLGLPTWELYTLGGIALVAAVYFVPYTYLYSTGSLALTDPQLEDAGRIAGAGPLRVLAAVTLPLLRPALVYSTLLTLVSSMELLSIPLVLGSPVGIQVLASYLYKLGLVGGQGDYGGIAAVSVLMLLVITGLVWLQLRITGQERRFVTVAGKATRGRVLRLGALRWPLASLIGLYALLGVVLPLVGIVMQSTTAFLSPLVNPFELLTSQNYATVLGEASYVRSITNSLLVSSVGGAIGILFVALCTLVIYRSDFPGRRALAYMALYPRAIPGIIVGIGFLWAFLLLPAIGGMRNTLIALTIAFIMRFIPLAYGAVGPSVLRVSPELDRAARVAGAGWLQAMVRIMLPILRPALLSGFVLLFISFLKEYSSALFLFARGSEVIGTTMIELWRQGNSGPVAALSAIQLAITFVVLLVGQRVLGARLYG